MQGLTFAGRAVIGSGVLATATPSENRQIEDAFQRHSRAIEGLPEDTVLQVSAVYDHFQGGNGEKRHAIKIIPDVKDKSASSILRFNNVKTLIRSLTAPNAYDQYASPEARRVPNDAESWDAFVGRAVEAARQLTEHHPAVSPKVREQFPKTAQQLSQALGQFSIRQRLNRLETFSLSFVPFTHTTGVVNPDTGDRDETAVYAMIAPKNEVQQPFIIPGLKLEQAEWRTGEQVLQFVEDAVSRAEQYQPYIHA